MIANFYHRTCFRVTLNSQLYSFSLLVPSHPPLVYHCPQAKVYDQRKDKLYVGRKLLFNRDTGMLQSGSHLSIMFVLATGAIAPVIGPQAKVCDQRKGKLCVGRKFLFNRDTGAMLHKLTASQLYSSRYWCHRNPHHDWSTIALRQGF